jgi:hypothetical protein
LAAGTPEEPPFMPNMQSFSNHLLVLAFSDVSKDWAETEAAVLLRVITWNLAGLQAPPWEFKNSDRVAVDMEATFSELDACLELEPWTCRI